MGPKRGAGGWGRVATDDVARVRGPAASVRESFPLHLPGVRLIRDACFLHGYGEPALAV